MQHEWDALEQQRMQMLAELEQIKAKLFDDRILPTPKHFQKARLILNLCLQDDAFVCVMIEALADHTAKYDSSGLEIETQPA